MAKKKKQRSEEKEGFQFTNEIVGLVLILASILGFGNFGLVWTIVKKFSIFMFGSWYAIFLALILTLGIYLIIKRGKPGYFTARLLGVYSLVIAILVFSHVSYINTNQLEIKNILSSTFDNIQASFANFDLISNTGGGIIGCLISIAFVYFFAIEGAYIFSVLIFIFGIIMLFDITIADIFSMITNFFKRLFSKDNKNNEEESDEESEEEEPVDTRIKIHSVEDLKNYTNDEKTTEIEEPVIIEQNQVDTKYIKPSINENSGPSDTVLSQSWYPV